MVDIEDKPIVTITGISGYCGSQIAQLFLQDGGYRVRGTVRDKNNAGKIEPLRQAFGELYDQLELVEADLSNESQLTSAITGAQYVVHVASPFFYGGTEAEMMGPAVEGTRSIMKACQDSGVKRCVITASIASVIYPTQRPEGLFNETHWSDPAYPGITPYAKSKLMAEKTAWDFHASLPAEEQSLELVVIMPSKVLGPSLRTESSVSIDFCKRLLMGEITEVPFRCFPMVDVRDLAFAHLQAIKVPEAKNRRFFCTNESVWFKDLVAPIADRFGSQGWPVTTTQAPQPENYDGYVIRMDNSASRDILGVQYRPYQETMIDMAQKMIEIQAVTKPSTLSQEK